MKVTIINLDTWVIRQSECPTGETKPERPTEDACGLGFGAASGYGSGKGSGGGAASGYGSGKGSGGGAASEYGSGKGSGGGYGNGANSCK